MTLVMIGVMAVMMGAMMFGMHGRHGKHGKDAESKPAATETAKPESGHAHH